MCGLAGDGGTKGCVVDSSIAVMKSSVAIAGRMLSADRIGEVNVEVLWFSGVLLSVEVGRSGAGARIDSRVG